MTVYCTTHRAIIQNALSPLLITRRVSMRLVFFEADTDSLKIMHPARSTAFLPMLCCMQPSVGEV